eukprot:GHVN01064337.1.p1 GENE.GHVN01064337.1~~GHVN01064337.1.p1  ORF type:complete len:105 (-),score=1.65 GHVN01064337.1:1413-1727(-)
MALTLAKTNHPSANALELVGSTLEQFDREEANHRHADFLTNGNGAYMDIQSLLRTLTLAMRVDKTPKLHVVRVTTSDPPRFTQVNSHKIETLESDKKFESSLGG